MASETPSAPLPRTRVGDYELHALLGGGGMGLVYAGTGPDDVRVAVKTLRAHLQGESDVQRFTREASIQIDHPNVVEVIGSGVDRDGTPFIVFELLEGESLEERVQRGPIEPAVALDIALQALEGLIAVHATGVIHRDVKPANLFVCADGTVKVLDFGIARVAGTDLTAEGTVVGTLLYLSPEQARGTVRVDARADVWAVGAVLFEMLTGSVPFDRTTPVGTLLAILNDPVPNAERYAPISKSFADVVSRCLRKSAEARWSDASALRDALKGLTQLTGIQVGSAQVPPADVGGHTLAGTGAAPAIRADEQRLVAVLLGRNVVDFDQIERAVTERGGRYFPLLGRDAIGLFGAQRWEGAELKAAVEAALDCRMAAQAVAVGTGRVRSSGVGIAGEALSAAERACDADMLGVGVDPATANAVRREFDLRRVRDAEVYEVTGTRRMGAAMEVDPPDALLGREIELAQIEAIARISLEQRRATLVVVEGPPGIGRTHFQDQLALLVARNHPHAITYSARCEWYRRDEGYSFFASLLRDRAERGVRIEQWPRIDQSAPVVERLSCIHRLASDSFASDLEPSFVDFLAHLLGVTPRPSPELRAAMADPRLMNDRLRLVVLDYFVARACHSPVIVCIDDAHWADASSIEVLSELMHKNADLPLFVVATMRQQTSSDSVIRRAAMLQVALGPLDPIASRTLALRVAGALPDDVADAVVERAGGNPLFIEQLAFDLRGRDTSRVDLSSMPLPLTVEAAVQSRFDRLGEREREACKLLSIFGRAATIDELRHLRPDVDLEQRLAGLAVAGLVALEELDERIWSFTSPLIGRVAYRMIVPELIESLHSNVARRLAEEGGAPEEEIARHFELGGQAGRAGSYYAKAAIGASRRADSARVIRCATAALSMGVEDDRLRFELHLAKADALRYGGARDEQAQELALAAEIAPAAEEHARVLHEQAVWLSRRGQLTEALERIGQARARAAEAEDTQLIAACEGRRGEFLVSLGEHAAAEEALSNAENVVAEDSFRLRGMIAEWRGLLGTARGDLDEAKKSFERAVHLARLAGDDRRSAGNLGNLADSYNRVGAFDDAIEALEAALVKCRRTGNALVEGFVLVNLAYAHTGAGQTEATLRRLSEAEQLARQDDFERVLTYVELYRARVLGDVGGARDALAAAVRAVEATEQGPASVRALAYALRARAEHRSGDISSALDSSRTAISSARAAKGAGEDEALVYLIRAQILEAADELDEATKVREEGRARVLEIASRISDEGWRQRFLENVPAHEALFAGP